MPWQTFASFASLCPTRTSTICATDVQCAMRPEALAQALQSLLTDKTSAEAQRGAFSAVLDQLHPPGLAPSEAAAEAVLAELDALSPAPG